MKNYVKPTMKEVELRPEEGLAYCGSIEGPTTPTGGSGGSHGGSGGSHGGSGGGQGGHGGSNGGIWWWIFR